jgi:PAS domain S-box-containing protein
MKMTKAELIDEVARLRRKISRMERAGIKLTEHERLLEESEQRYRQVMDASPIGITVCDSTGQCVAANDSIAEMVGARKEQVLRQNFHEIASWRVSGLYDAALKALKTGKPQKVDTELFITSFGKKIYLSCYVVPFPKGGLLFMAEDQTARRTAEEKLKRKTMRLKIALSEKEILLSEVHHRVKNNLAVVSSILQMQIRYIKDQGFRDIFKECQNRIRSMALVHEQLYGSSNFASIDLRRYVTSLVEMLSHSLLNIGSDINIKSRVARVELNTEQLISVGMIINEALTNSLKHAFPKGGPGNISVSVRRKGDDMALVISDDGIGFSLPEGGTGSMGLKLIHIFSEQLGGSLDVLGHGGTEIRVIFRGGL